MSNMEGAGRYDKLHGDEDGVEVTDAHRAEAKADILETIELFGQYPQPPHKGVMVRRDIKFLLSDFITEELDPSDVADDLVRLLTTNRLDHLDAVSQITARIMEQVAADSLIEGLVDEVAGEIALQEREDA